MNRNDLTGLEKAVNLEGLFTPEGLKVSLKPLKLLPVKYFYTSTANWSLLKDLPTSVTTAHLEGRKGKPDLTGFPDHLVNLTELTIFNSDINSLKHLPSRYFDQITTLELGAVEIPNLCDPSSEFTKFNSLENLTTKPVIVANGALLRQRSQKLIRLP